MTLQARIDTAFMREALYQADAAALINEIPVGALLVLNNEVIARGHNQSVAEHDATAHAEVVVVRAACTALRTNRLDGATLYVTIEPCLMCCGALLQARIARLVYGAREPRTGAVVSAWETLMAPQQTHHVAITEGIEAAACRERMQAFFALRRKCSGQA